MNVPSQLEAVTVYASGAVCSRRAKLAAPIEPTRQLRLIGLPLSLRPTSLRARVLVGDPALRVLDVRAGFEVQLADEVDVPAEQKAIESAEAEVARLEAALARVVAESQEISALRPEFPTLRKGEPPRAAPVEAMLQLADFVDRELAERNVRTRALEQERDDARNVLQLHRNRLAEASSSKRTERARLTRCAVVTLSAQPAAGVELGLEYQVPGARWVPNYELRLEKGMTGGALKMRASVAQGSGEDWEGVRLSLSTALLDRRTDLPELRSLRIGRSQPPPPKSGWREPPPGLDDLFEGYTDAVRSVGGGGSKRASPPRAGMALPPRSPAPPPPPVPMAAPMQQATPARAAAPGSARRSDAMARSASFGGAAALGSAMPDVAMKARSSNRMREESDEGMASMDFDGSAPAEESMRGIDALAEAEVAPATVQPERSLLDYDRLTIPQAFDPGSPPPSRLQPASEWEFAFISTVSVQVDVVNMLITRALQTAARAEELPLPAHARSVRQSAAAFDYRFDCEAPVDVPSTSKWSLVPVMVAPVALRPGYSCVPSVEPKVYRVLKIQNPSGHALLQGPVDVSVGDEFLMTTLFPTVPPRGEEARLGLGVEEAVKVSRKTQFNETTSGLLKGSTVLPHEIEIEVSNRLPFPAAVEIRERVPVSQDEDVKIEELQVKPPWEKDEKLRDGVQTDGARCWQITVPPGEKTKVTAQFSIKIPTDKMLVGGNRRV